MKKDYLSYIIIYTFAYAAIGAMTPLIGQYLHYIGFSGTQVGIVTGTGTAVAIFAGIFWGRMYANSRDPHILISILCIGAAVLALILSGVNMFPVFLVGFGVMYFFQSPIMALSDTMTIETGHSFGAVRLWGAIGFAFSVFVTGRAAGLVSMKSIFFIYIGCYLITAAAVIYVVVGSKGQGRLIPGRGNSSLSIKEPKRKYSDLLGNKKLIYFVICAFCIGGTNVANNTYFGFLYSQGGGSIAGIGVAFLLMAGSEAPFMGWVAWLRKRFTMEGLILFAVVLSVLRFAWYGTVPGYVMLLVTFFLQGIVNGILLVEMVRYAAALSGEKYRSMGIASYYVANNCSTILCQLAGGAILDRWGPGGVYLFFAALNALGGLLYVIFGLNKQIK